MKTVLPLIAVVTLVSASASAQQQNAPQPDAVQQQQNAPQPNAGQQQNTQQPNGEQQQSAAAPNAQPVSPQDFVQKVESDTHYEIGAGQLGVRKAQDPAIRVFAFRLVRDHALAAAALEEIIAVDHDVDLPADTPMTADENQMIEALKSASGDNFDATYVQQLVNVHRQAVALFDNYLRDGNDRYLRTFANRTAQMIHNHLIAAERMQRLESQLSVPMTTGRSSAGGNNNRGNAAGGQAPAPSGNPAAPQAAPSASGGSGAAPETPMSTGRSSAGGNGNNNPGNAAGGQAPAPSGSPATSPAAPPASGGNGAAPSASPGGSGH